MSTTDDLIPLLKKLRLSGVLQSLDLRMKLNTEPLYGNAVESQSGTVWLRKI